MAITLSTTTLFTSFAAGCEKNEQSSFERGEKIEYLVPEYETYSNHIEIDGQWLGSGYGVGDPFVMRYNGKYYLYPSTADGNPGIKVFESDDLINWTYKGYAVDSSILNSQGAYAPEVIYYNGYFYMCQSRGGNGHYIYRSESPTEGFVLVSKTDDMDESNINYGNLGLGIDGSFYVDDDGKLYLLHTLTSGGLKYNEITDVNNIKVDTISASKTLGTANLNAWIEGPGTFRRGTYSYLTYTGNHVWSRGYRVAYSYAENLKNLSAYTQPVENVTLIDSDSSEHYGLGHSSNTNGPNLDSVYTAYHSTVGIPFRRYNLDRYFAFGGLVSSNGTTHREVAVPERPDMETSDASGLSYANNVYSLGKSGDYFTAEYNFIPTSGQKIIFGATDSKRYEITVENGKISLCEVNGNNRTTLGEKDVYIASGKLGTVRVENGDGIGYVYFNGMRVITYNARASAGYIGYAIKDGVNYTACTNDVFGTSDFETIKNFPLTFSAVTYLKGENRGFSIANAKVQSGGVRVGEKQDIAKIDDYYAVNLGKEDWVKYAVDIGENGDFVLGAKVTVDTKATLKITIGNEVLTCDVSGANNSDNGDGKTVNVVLGKMRLEKGVHTMKVEVVSGSASIISFTTEEKAETLEQIKLEDFVVKSGNASVKADSISVSATGTSPACVTWGNEGLSNFELTFDFVIDADVSANLGVMLRSQNYSYFSSQPTQSWQGYYLMLQPQFVSVRRYNYNDTYLSISKVNVLNDGKKHSMAITVNNNVITYSIDGGETFSVCDAYAYLSGYIGFYSLNGTLTITNPTFKNL